MTLLYLLLTRSFDSVFSKLPAADTTLFSLAALFGKMTSSELLLLHSPNISRRIYNFLICGAWLSVRSAVAGSTPVLVTLA